MARRQPLRQQLLPTIVSRVFAQGLAPNPEIPLSIATAMPVSKVWNFGLKLEELDYARRS